MLAVNSYLCFSPSNLKIITTEGQYADVFLHCRDFKGNCFSHNTGYTGNQLIARSATKAIRAVISVPSGVNGSKVPSSSVEKFIITASSPDKDNKVKIFVEVSGIKTQEIYDKVFLEMVKDTPPLPGFRRVKGGKTPNIPKDVLLEILGPSKVYEQVIKKVINSSIAHYAAKERLGVGKDLQIEQSFEDLVAEFEPGGKFRFDAIVRFQDLK